MGIEIERKFLLVGDAWRAQVTRSVLMQQGYLAADAGRSSVRVRVEAGRSRLNIKASTIGTTRAEYEYDLPLTDAQEILSTLCVGVLEKTRHYVTAGAHTFEIDEFSGANAGLIVAEVELSTADEYFVRPAWLGRELSHDRRYYNHYLALRPFTQWPRRIEVDIAKQTLQLLEGAQCLQCYSVSTAANGAGERNGSGCTPRGQHRVRAMIGGEAESGSVFVGRRATGERYSAALAEQHPNRDWILTRILWLGGCELGLNRHGDVGTQRRYIYIHGTPDEAQLGTPVSHGCIRMRNSDVIELFDLVQPGIEVSIYE